MLVTIRAGDSQVLDTVQACSRRPAELRVGYVPRVFPPGFTGGGVTKNGVTTFMPRPTPPVRSAQVWLMHTSPSNANPEVQSTTLMTSNSTRFTFQPVTIHASEGDVTVVVSVDIVRYPDRPDQFTLRADRVVTYTSSDRKSQSERRESGDAQQKTIASANDVFSFELPPIQLIPAGPLPDQLSVRVRFGPLATGSPQ